MEKVQPLWNLKSEYTAFHIYLTAHIQQKRGPHYLRDLAGNYSNRDLFSNPIIPWWT